MIKAMLDSVIRSIGCTAGCGVYAIVFCLMLFAIIKAIMIVFGWIF